MSDHKSFKMTSVPEGWYKHWAVRAAAVLAVLYGVSGILGLH